jgi:UDP-N-acetylglucosamine 2-epimerase (non-hydrolysing)
MNILVIFGTRPEFIKLAPVIKELKNNNNILTKACSTGQHDKLLNDVINDFDVKIDYKLNTIAKNKSLNILSSRLLKSLDEIFEKVKPDWVLIQGDTSTSTISALAAFYRGIKIAHIEAGLRTDDLQNPFPEEGNRQIISRISDINFAPTKSSVLNLLKEGIKKNKILLTGNTIVDSINYIKKLKFTPKNIKHIHNLFLKDFNFNPSKKFIYVTFHRRENHGENLHLFINLLKKIVSNYPHLSIIIPVHLNPKVKNALKSNLSKINNIILLPSISYINSLFLIRNCEFIISDSGGIQEESPSFNKKIIVLRKFTERMEGVRQKIAFLVDFDEYKFMKKIDYMIRVNNLNRTMKNPYGDGKSSLRIVNFFQDYKL